METYSALFRQGRKEDIWQRYCGFLDLDVRGFLTIQERLLMEQLARVGHSHLGRSLLGDRIPATVDEFRRRVPLTTYEDYEPYLREKNETHLAEKPLLWARTSGRTGKPKWLPYTAQMVDVFVGSTLAIFILACARQRGEVQLAPGDRLLHNTAPIPYTSGWLVHAVEERTDFRFLPPAKDSVLGFQERVEMSFQMAMRDGVDLLFSLSSVLMRIGDSFAQGGSNAKLSREMLHPAILWRLARGLVKSRLQRRPLKPSDLWSPKGMLVGGMDTGIFKAKLQDYWGVEPHENYAATECCPFATQAWTRRGMYFMPDVAFFEFIPKAESEKASRQPTYVPQTVLLDEVEPGRAYEVVLTQFYGGPLVRYRMFDLVRFVAGGEPDAGIRLPSMEFEARTSDLIDLMQFTGPMSEKQIWAAMVHSGLPHKDWVARKEVLDGKPVLHMYVEPKGPLAHAEAHRRIHESIAAVNADYATFEHWMSYHPLRLTLLPEGAFAAYIQAMVAKGADLAHLKPPHMNASDEVMALLLGTEQTAVPQPVMEDAAA